MFQINIKGGVKCKAAIYGEPNGVVVTVFKKANITKC